jgi:uncharacterized membrane protein YphA (DoxX/SURF4 family)
VRTKTISYWTTTIMLAFALISGGAAQAAHLPQNVEGIRHLGYPLYFMTILGIWKILGGIALLVPRFPRLKEWAYAGTFFEMTGASISHAVCGDAAMHIVVPMLFAVLAIASWALRPASRTLGAVLPASGPVLATSCA